MQIYTLYSIPPSPTSGHLTKLILVWYYYDIPELQPRQESQIPVSQIPVLNGVKGEEISIPPPRRGGEGIDSKYIALAKAGGRKGTFIFYLILCLGIQS